MNENEKEINNEPEKKSKLSGKMIAVISSAAVAVVAIIATVTAILLSGGNADNGGNGGENTPVTPVTYTITVTDPDGNPVSDVWVYLTAPDGSSKMRVSSTDGTATYKNMTPADYTVTLEQGQSTASIPTNASYSVPKGTTSLTITLSREINEDNKTQIFGAGFSESEPTYAYFISAGVYTASLTEGMNYYIFTTNSSGVYEIKVDSSDGDVTVGVYGNPLNVFQNDISNSEGKRTLIEVTPLNVGDNPTPFVIGIDSSAALSCNFSISKISNVEDDPSYHPWNDVSAKQAPGSKVVIPSGKTLVDFDITNRNLKVSLNEADKCYYTNDGRLVYIRVSKDSPYLAAFALIAGFIDENVAQTFGGYIYNNGQYVGKNRYNGMIETYHNVSDTTYGVVPLTEELAEAIKITGEHNGWWNPESNGFRLSEVVGLYAENAWLFACMIESK